MHSQLVNSIVLSDNDFLSLMVNVKSPPPPVMSAVMEERVMEDRVTILIPVTLTSAVVSDMLGVPTNDMSESEMVPDVPVKRQLDVTETVRVVSEI